MEFTEQLHTFMRSSQKFFILERVENLAITINSKED